MTACHGSSFGAVRQPTELRIPTHRKRAHVCVHACMHACTELRIPAHRKRCTRGQKRAHSASGTYTDHPHWVKTWRPR